MQRPKKNCEGIPPTTRQVQLLASRFLELLTRPLITLTKKFMIVSGSKKASRKSISLILQSSDSDSQTSGCYENSKVECLTLYGYDQIFHICDCNFMSRVT
jgi:hypothetical protein